MLKKKIKLLIRSYFYAANPRIVFSSKKLLTPVNKNPVSNLNKKMVIYQCSCCCKAFYKRLKAIHLKKRIKEPKSIELLTKFSAIDERLNAFITLTGISSFLYEIQKFSTFFGTCSFILFFRCR